MQEVLSGLKHTFYIFSHPFDGFWIMKSEKKGNTKSATVILALLIVTTAIRFLGSGYLFTSSAVEGFSAWTLMIIVLALVAVYCVANWALTTLMNGNGSMKDIYISLMYAVTPIVLVNIPLTLLTHVLTLEEGAFLTLINALSIIWSLFLLLVGNMSIHEYTMMQSIATVILSALGIIGIAVLLLLVFNLMQEVWLWVLSIFNELIMRF